jgi:hypothetical protein
VRLSGDRDIEIVCVCVWNTLPNHQRESLQRNMRKVGGIGSNFPIGRSLKKRMGVL